MEDPITVFSKPLQRIILEKGFREFTEPQAKAIPVIMDGKNVLIIAPTGTGKTEAAFLPVLDRMIREGGGGGIRVLYISPLRALNRDLLDRLHWWCSRLDLKVSVRHGDTETKERGRQALAPPDIMITTPETLQAMLPGRNLRKLLSKVRWIIVDEIHELANDKRGTQLTVALERLREITAVEPQIIGLSATIGSPERVARFLVGDGRKCEIVRVPVAKHLVLDVLLPEAVPEDYELAERLATFPEVAARLRMIKELIEKNRSTLIFTNTRSEAEALASRFRIWDINTPISIHHGSLAKSSRIEVETSLKRGELRGVVCTSSLELGIDIGNVDLVIQYNSPRQVTRILQRVGRSGHWVGGVSRGVIVTMDSDDALESAVIVRRALREELEEVRSIENPYDVLAHQLAGILLEEGRRSIDEVLSILRRAAPFSSLEEKRIKAVLEYMSGRRPRLALFLPDEGMFIKTRPADPLYEYYFENLSMIPEERHYVVIDEQNDEAIGLLDEAFVAEYGEPGVKFIVRGSPWKIIQVYKNTVYVRSEEDPTGAIPDWIGDEIPVPFEIAQEVGRIRGKVACVIRGGGSYEEAIDGTRKEYPVSVETLRRALREVKEQAEGRWDIPTDENVTVEGWEGYIIISCAFGLMINKALSRVLGYLITQRTGSGVGTSQDAYRVFLKANMNPILVAEMLRNLDPGEAVHIAKAAVERTGLFRRRLIHVAKRMGVISKDAEIGDLGSAQLVENLKGTIVFEEAMSEVFSKDLDLEGLVSVVKGIREGRFRVSVMNPELPISPISRIGIRELSWKTDLVPADRLRRLMIESTKARLLNEARIAVCTDCFRFSQSVKMKSFVDGFKCPECGSRKLGLLDEDPSEVAQMAAEMSELGRVSEKHKAMLKEAVETGALVEEFGLAAALAIASRNLPKPVVFTLATMKVGDLDTLVDLIIKEERSALKSRFRARRQEREDRCAKPS
ncbi:MAG: DEAD/DEAH box helicase [Candidatus Verstraetearchaeota archaeon]|nr:DEAD/DEAH box helicase [Candidatus Verstraetearchaeota archaeon]